MFRSQPQGFARSLKSHRVLRAAFRQPWRPRSRRQNSLSISWLGLALGLIVGFLMIKWWRNPYIEAATYAQWWRVAYQLHHLNGLDPLQGLYPVELPLYQQLQRFVILVTGGTTGQDFLWLPLAISTVGCLSILLLCWGRGNIWGAGLWGFNTWMLQAGLQPNSEALAALLLLISALVPLPFGFVGLAMVCSLSAKSWPLATALTLLWLTQCRPQQRAWGVWLVGGSIVVMTLIQGGIPWAVWQPQGSSLLPILAPLMLSFGLVLVRIRFPWSHRGDALISVAVASYCLMWLVGLWMATRSIPSGSPTPFQGLTENGQGSNFGLLVLPLSCWVAARVLEEISERFWQILLGGVLLLGSLLLSLQTLHQLPQSLIYQYPARAAAHWLSTHKAQIASVVVVDNPIVAYYSQLPLHQLIGSLATQSQNGVALPPSVNWVVVDRSDPRSPLVNQYPEFLNQTRQREWELMFSSSQSSHQLFYYEDSESAVAIPNPPPSLRVPALPVIQIWRRVGIL